VTLDLVSPADGMIGIQLYRGSLLQPAHPSIPWFCLVSDVRIGLGGTCVTDAECCDPGAVGNIMPGSLVAVAGFPAHALRVTNTMGVGGVDTPGGVFVDNEPSGPGAIVARDRRWSDPRYEAAEREGEMNELAALVRLNLNLFDFSIGKRSDLVYEAASTCGIKRVFIMGDTYGNVSRLLIGRDGVPEVAMGFLGGKLVYFATGPEPTINFLPGKGRLFLPSEGAHLRCLPGSR
jgi:hypothetical protein